MPSSLISARIRGIRSYSPLESVCQTIDFMPLTLIVGANGTGKTTIIESLKFIVSGEEPPHSDCRRNFIHTPGIKDRKVASGDGSYASIEINFRNAFGEVCKAKREITRFGGSKSGPPSLSSGYKIGQNSWIYVHRQDDWNKVMPKLFGLPNQAILSNVILCHQEDNLWCMGESSNVKQVYDKIFGCEQYKKEIKHIDDEIRNCKKEIAIEEKCLVLLREKVQRKKSTARNLELLEVDLSKTTAEIKDLDSKINSLNNERETYVARMKAEESRTLEVDSLRRRIKELLDKEGIYQSSLSNLLCVKRPASVIQKQQPLKKKQVPDPTAVDLEIVIENFNKMTKLVDSMPKSDDLDSLKSLIDETIEKLHSMRKRYSTPATETPQPEPEESRQEDEMFEKLESHRRDLVVKIESNQKELQDVRAKVQLLQEQIKNDTNVELVRRELTEVESKILQMRDERSMKAGSKNRMERELQNLRAEHLSYKDVNKDCARCLGKLVIHQVIMDDLEKLKKCFLESITSFHEHMIEKINQLLRARWKQIYQGTDIEYISLVAEEIAKSKEKKSYNYHMVMRKNGLDMRMREKSSAGQRALAAIIVRMTLAELFVRDFAFIALDEPTANLDLANVQALAKSIGCYVQKRNRKGANIQWIIITHDEQFLRALDEKSSPFYYRIQLDPSDGCSRIVKLSSRSVEFQKLANDDRPEREQDNSQDAHAPILPD